MNTSDHWDAVYGRCGRTGVSWYRDHLDVSLSLIHAAKVGRNERILDIGGGASTLVDDLLADGYTRLGVVDLSPAALEMSRQRLGAAAGRIDWLAGNVLQLPLPVHDCALWHDRAVFHFLTRVEERTAYVRAAARTLKPGGHLIVGTFSPEGPRRCSGLEVVRYDMAGLCAAFGPSFRLVKSETEMHATPGGRPQSFVYGLFQHQA